MADYRTEEEQIELLKKWWNENGKAIVIGVLVALVLFFGVQKWRGYQQTTNEAAADLFQQMLVVAEASPDAAKVAEFAEQLRKEYPNTVYGVFATLRLARNAVVANDLIQAVTLLESVQGQHPDKTLQPLVNLRLAQVQYAQGELDKALVSLAAIKSAGAWQATVSELRGDILSMQGKTEEARNAYTAALTELEAAGNQEQRATLEMKLSGLVKPISNAVSGEQP